MNNETTDLILKALSEHSSTDFNTSSGSVLELMREFAKKDNLRGVSETFISLAKVYPKNAAYVRGRVPAIIWNFHVCHRNINPTAMIKWHEKNPDWGDGLKKVAHKPDQFARAVEALATAVYLPVSTPQSAGTR